MYITSAKSLNFSGAMYEQLYAQTFVACAALPANCKSRIEGIASCRRIESRTSLYSASFNSDLTVKFNGLKQNETTIILLELIDLSGRVCATQLIEVSNLDPVSTFFAGNKLISNTYIMRASTSYGYAIKKIIL
jgi:hypothetical protein